LKHQDKESNAVEGYQNVVLNSSLAQGLGVELASYDNGKDGQVLLNRQQRS